jgi:flagellar motor switch protein FliM
VTATGYPDLARPGHGTASNGCDAVLGPAATNECGEIAEPPVMPASERLATTVTEGAPAAGCLGTPNEERRGERPAGTAGGSVRPAAGGATPAGSGMLTLARARRVGHERLPAFDLALDHLARALTPALRSFTSREVDVQIASISTRPFDACLRSVQPPAVFGVFRAVPWEERGLVAVDGGLASSIVDLLLGGRHDLAPTRAEGRSPTAIETTLVERLIRLALEALGDAFAPMAPVQFRGERIETSPQLAAIAHADSPCVLCRLGVKIGERGGMLELLMPHAMLEPARELLLQEPVAQKPGRSRMWTEHLAHEVWLTRVELAAVLEERTIDLREALGFRAGTILHLRARTDSPVSLRHGPAPIAAGVVGRSGDRLVVKVEKLMEHGGEAVDA